MLVQTLTSSSTNSVFQIYLKAKLGMCEGLAPSEGEAPLVFISGKLGQNFALGWLGSCNEAKRILFAAYGLGCGGRLPDHVQNIRTHPIIARLVAPQALASYHRHLRLRQISRHHLRLMQLLHAIPSIADCLIHLVLVFSEIVVE